MKLVNVLSSVIVEDVRKRDSKLVMEVSKKVLQQLIDKFKKEDSNLKDQDIIDKVNEFEKYKNQLPVEKRDLFRLTYSELSKILSGKESTKTSKDLFTQLKDNSKKAGEPPVEDAALRRSIRQLMDISGEVPKDKMNLGKSTYLQIVEFLNKNYLKLLITAMKKKFPEISDEIIQFYANSYTNNITEVPVNTPPLKNLSFQDIEHIVDGIEAKKGYSEKSSNTKYGDIPMVYPAKGEPEVPNLEIYAPRDKPDCIKLKNGRRWCTSREGGSNLYYNYRLDRERTLYYIIDGDKPFSDDDYAVVILVDPRGSMALADGTNKDEYSGHQNLPWEQIVNKIPKLKDLKHIFKPNPLTDSEQELARRYRNFNLNTDNPIEELGSENEVEIWMEVSSKELNDAQFAKLTDNLQKKYIALGHILTKEMISSLGSSSLSYYISKKKESLKNKSLKDLTNADIALLNTPMLKGLKNERKSDLRNQIGETPGNSQEMIIKYPNNNLSKFIDLYGFPEMFNQIPKTIENLDFFNESNTPIEIVLPEEFSELKNMRSLCFKNCFSEIPEVIGRMESLNFLSFYDCPNLDFIPPFIAKLPNLQALVLSNCSPNLVISPEVKERFENPNNSAFLDIE
jgi:hypothetical protein